MPAQVAGVHAPCSNIKTSPVLKNAPAPCPAGTGSLGDRNRGQGRGVGHTVGPSAAHAGQPCHPQQPASRPRLHMAVGRQVRLVAGAAVCMLQQVPAEPPAGPP